MKEHLSRRLTSLLLGLALLGTLVLPVGAAAGEGSQTPADPPETPAASVTLPETATILIDGDSNPLTLTATPSAGLAPKSVEWKSETPTAAKVAWTEAEPFTCLVTAQNVSASAPRQVEVTITVTLDDNTTLSDSCTLTIGRQPGEIRLTDDEHFLEPPAPGTIADPWPGLTASILPSDAIYEDQLVWSSSDESVATVEAEPGVPLHAMITPVAVGKTIIKATLPGSGLEASCVIEVSGVTLPEELTLTVGDLHEFSTDENYRIYGNAYGQLPVWSSTGSAIANVSSGTRLVARRVGTTTITLTMGGYSAQCDVTVVEDLADAIDGGTLAVGSKLELTSVLSALNAASSKQLEDSLDYLTGLSVSTDAGVIYYGYISPDSHNHGVGASERYYVSGAGRQLLSDVSFVPASGFNGTAVISYTGVGKGGGSFKGTIRVNVVHSGDVTYSTPNNRPVPMEVRDFATVCQNSTGGTLRHVIFYDLPDPTQGTFYYNYSPAGQYSQKVSSSTQYRVSGSSSLLEDVTFVPNPDFVGTLRIPYYAYNASNNRHFGTLTIQIYAADGSTSNANVTYYAGLDSVTPMGVADFEQACQSAGAGFSALSHIYFDALPNRLEEGTLYYNYTASGSYGARVSTSNRYYAGNRNTPSLALVSFVPVPGFLGTVTIPYTGYDTDSAPFEGKLIIHVREGDHGIRYTTGAGWPAPFQEVDFNEACRSQHGSPLSTITFQLPDVRQGTLYRNYVSGSAYNTTVTAQTPYERHEISSISFVPAVGFTGTVTIPFNGKTESGVTFNGSVYIDVGAAKMETVRYSTVSGGWVNFTAAEFNAASMSLTGENVDYVTFTSSPTAGSGTLYRKYRPADQNGDAVHLSTPYYRSATDNQIGDITFAAAPNYLGTATFQYSGVSVGGLPFQGQVEITVTTPAAKDVKYTTRSLPVSLSAGDFRAACTGILRSDLSYIEITALPDASRGKLLMNYNGPNTGSPATTKTRYYVSGSPSIASLSFLPRAEYTGTVSIPYTAVDARGNTLPGIIAITTGGSYGSDPFRDTDSFAWAEGSIEFLSKYNIVTGSGGGNYSPGLSIKRCDFVLMLCRTFQFSPVLGASFPDVPAGTYYTDALSTAKALGIVKGDNWGNFNPNATLTRQDAMVMLQRALSAAHITTPTVSAQVLTALYRDGAHVSSYAQSAIASMVQMGVLKGDDKGMLNPHSSIRRAEMAVILHRVLTY